MYFIDIEQEIKEKAKKKENIDNEQKIEKV